MDVLDRLIALWLPWLLWTSLQTLLLASLVGLLNRCLPRLRAATRCVLWWLVGLQVLAGLGHRLGWAWPWSGGGVVMSRRLPLPAVLDDAGTSAGALLPGHPAIHEVLAHAQPWLRAAFLAWLLSVLAQAMISLIQARQARQLRRDSQPLQQELLQTLAAIQAQAMGLRRMPEVRVAPGLHSPVVSGLWRPMILLPGANPLEADEAAMAIAHEMAHVRRADLWLGWIPALARHLLCFHPALWWSNREYRLQRESACDDLAMQYSRPDLQAYGRLLLRFGTGRRTASQLGGAAVGRGDLQRRLKALRNAPEQLPERRWQVLAAMLLAMLGVLPYRLSLADNSAPVAAPQTPPVMPVTPPPPIPPAPVILAPQPPSPAVVASPAKGKSTTTTASGKLVPSVAWAAFDGQTLYFQGSRSDQLRFARSRQGQQPLLWYRRGQQVYLSHDPQLIRELISRLQAPATASTQAGHWRPAQQALLQRQWQNAAAQQDLAARQVELAADQASAHRLWIQRLWQARLAQPLPAASSIRPATPAPHVQQPPAHDELASLRQQQQSLQQQMQAMVRQQQALAAQPHAGSQPVAVQPPVQQLLDDAVRQGLAKPLEP